MLDSLLMDLNNHLLYTGDCAKPKMMKFINTNINQYVLHGFDYEAKSEILTLRLLRRNDNALVVRQVIAKPTIFNLSDEVFLNHLSDVLYRLDLMSS